MTLDAAGGADRMSDPGDPREISRSSPMHNTFDGPDLESRAAVLEAERLADLDSGALYAGC
jgi:hypothetical protein